MGEERRQLIKIGYRIPEEERPPQVQLLLNFFRSNLREVPDPLSKEGPPLVLKQPVPNRTKKRSWAAVLATPAAVLLTRLMLMHCEVFFDLQLKSSAEGSGRRRQWIEVSTYVQPTCPLGRPQLFGGYPCAAAGC